MATKIILFFLCLSLSTGLLAQYNSKGAVKSRFKPGIGWHYKGIRPADTSRVHRYDRWIIDICHNSYNGEMKPFTTRAKSIGVGLGFLFDQPLSKGNKISLGYGLQYRKMNFSHDAAFVTWDNPKSTKLYPLTNNDHYSLRYHQVAVPLELRFRNESWRHFKVHLGGSIGYLFGMHTKFKYYSNDNSKIITKSYDLKDINRLQYGAHIRFGLRNWALIGGYQFSTLFKSAESAQLNAIYAGLSISLF